MTRRAPSWRIIEGVLPLVLVATGCDHTFVFDAPRDGGQDSPTVVAPEPCVDDTGCALSSLHCEVGAGQCVACLIDDDCVQSGLPRCDVTLHRCVECRNFDDCAAGMTCIQAAHACVTTCAGPDDCPPPEYECDLGRGVCEGCERRADCAFTPDKPICDIHSRICVECVSDSDCEGDEPHCDPAIARCVACTSSVDCPVPTPWCDPVAHRCVLAR